MLIEELSMKEFEERLKRTQTLFIPFGSVEEHGSHLPLSTDTIQAYEVGKKVAERIPIFVAPPVHYGSCRSTSCHPGTISISTATLKSLLKDIIRSSNRIGLKNFLVLTGHAGGSHRMALQDAGEELLLELEGIKIAVVTEYELAKEEGRNIVETPNDSHAGEIETSRILHTHPHLVKGEGIPEMPSFPVGILVKNKRKFWPGGVWGDPSKASAKKGEMIEKVVVDKVIELVKELEAFQE
ncbi:MAG: creatininase family protein [Desulfuromonadales bacterium]|nr:creatininase family protein [Desulfuromonadales bacterium]